MDGYGGREERGECISLLSLIHVHANETRCAEQTSETVNNCFQLILISVLYALTYVYIIGYPEQLW